MIPAIILSCEHASNHVPGKYQVLFADAEADIQSHRGWDPGALELARQLQALSHMPVLHGEVTRLLIEINRSVDNPELWSEYTTHLSQKEKRSLIDTYYHPYLLQLSNRIKSTIHSGQHALHVSVHSFTPVWHEKPRTVDIGILFDPQRTEESNYAHAWIDALKEALPALRIIPNAPYAGTDDGLTTILRKQFSPDKYSGIEIEVSQALFAHPEWEQQKNTIADTLAKASKKQ